MLGIIAKYFIFVYRLNIIQGPLIIISLTWTHAFIDHAFRVTLHIWGVSICFIVIPITKVAMSVVSQASLCLEFTAHIAPELSVADTGHGARPLSVASWFSDR